MFIESHYLVYPDGDTQEIHYPAQFNSLVGINGEPIHPPILSGSRIVYRVFRIQRKEEKGERKNFYFLEMLRGEELFSILNA